MSTAEQKFQNIADLYTSKNEDVYLGKMMSSPGLKYKDKVFAFQHKEEMGFRLGPQFDPEKFGLKNVQPLSPFKSKPPLKGWFMIHEMESNTWETLTELSLAFTKTLK